MYDALVGPLGEPPSIDVECIFADPIADIAVLSAVDNQELPEEAERFDELVDAMTVLTVAAACPGNRGRLLSLRVERAGAIGLRADREFFVSHV